MSQSPQQLSNDKVAPLAPLPAESPALLEMLSILRNSQRKRWSEITCAIVLALATVGSTWCAYQSNLWSGVQSFRLADASQANRLANRHSVEAIERRLFDGVMLIHYVEAHLRRDEAVRQFLLARFRPEMKPAVDAWLAADPFTNPSAPATPFQLKQYAQADLEQVNRFAEKAQAAADAAQRANQYGDRYVLMTVLFASVLFFAGIGDGGGHCRHRVVHHHYGADAALAAMHRVM